jgi:hypothetical protein
MDPIAKAKKAVLAAAEGGEWLRGIGTSVVDGKRGLVVNVREADKVEASRIIEKLELPVPVRVRAVGDIRARGQFEKPAGSADVEQLREIARRRSLARDRS